MILARGRRFKRGLHPKTKGLLELKWATFPGQPLGIFVFPSGPAILWVADDLQPTRWIWTQVSVSWDTGVCFSCVCYHCVPARARGKQGPLGVLVSSCSLSWAGSLRWLPYCRWRCNNTRGHVKARCYQHRREPVSGLDLYLP